MCNFICFVLFIVYKLEHVHTLVRLQTLWNIGCVVFVLWHIAEIFYMGFFTVFTVTLVHVTVP